MIPTAWAIINSPRSNGPRRRSCANENICGPTQLPSPYQTAREGQSWNALRAKQLKWNIYPTMVVVPGFGLAVQKSQPVEYSEQRSAHIGGDSACTSSTPTWRAMASAVIRLLPVRITTCAMPAAWSSLTIFRAAGWTVSATATRPHTCSEFPTTVTVLPSASRASMCRAISGMP
jgi:hypothetical protein